MSSHAQPLPPTSERNRGVKTILITCGPTFEPIDAVRFIGNRSSGRMGLTIAAAAMAKGWAVRVLSGPGVATSGLRGGPEGNTLAVVMEFRTTADLQALLARELAGADVLVMAAAVADYRPRAVEGVDREIVKLRRSEGGLSIELEATPDLLAECSRNRRPGQVLVGFALEPRERLVESATSKLERKGVDAIVANPLATMDSPTIEGVLVTRAGALTPGSGGLGQRGIGEPMSKEAFAAWLMDQIEHMHAAARLLVDRGAKA